LILTDKPIQVIHFEAEGKPRIVFAFWMAPSTITKAYYSTPESQIQYRYLKSTVANVTKSPIILLHMPACSSLYFVDFIEKLAGEAYDVYAWGIPG